MVMLKASKNACIKARSATSSYGESVEMQILTTTTL